MLEGDGMFEHLWHGHINEMNMDYLSQNDF